MNAFSTFIFSFADVSKKSIFFDFEYSFASDVPIYHLLFKSTLFPINIIGIFSIHSFYTNLYQTSIFLKLTLSVISYTNNIPSAYQNIHFIID